MGGRILRRRRTESRRNSGRTEYISQAAEALNESTFPRLHALVYYDHDSSGMGADYLPAYKRYLSSPFFTANDANEA